MFLSRVGEVRFLCIKQLKFLTFLADADYDKQRLSKSSNDGLINSQGVTDTAFTKSNDLSGDFPDFPSGKKFYVFVMRRGGD